MTRRRLIALLVAVLLLGALGFYLAQPKEPSYKGRRFSQWVLECEKYESKQGDSASLCKAAAAEQAITEIGTNAFPYLLSELAVVDSWPKARIASVVNAWGHKQVHIRTESD